MTSLDIVQQRLHNQHLIGAPFARPDQVGHWFGAVQAQEYPGATWGIAQRLDGVTQTTIDQAYADGAILRTHAMRPTWHFVAPADIRWLLALTSPRVHAVNASYYRKLVHVSRSCFPVPTMDDRRWTMALSSIVDRLSSPEPATNIRRAALVSG